MPHSSAMKVIVTLALVLLMQAPAPAAPDGVVAVVNGEALSRGDFTAALVHGLGSATLDGYIDWVLVRQEARKHGVTIAEGELEQRKQLEIRLRMRRLYDGARMTPDEFAEAATAYGWEPSHARREIERSITAEMLRVPLLAEKVLRSRITITEAEVRAYYDRTEGERFSAAHIVVAQEAQARGLCEALRAQPDRWADAVWYSLDRASIPLKGRIRTVAASSRLGKVFADMQPGELRIYHEAPAGRTTGAQQARPESWHVLRLLRRVPPTGRSFAEARAALKSEVYCRRVSDMLAQWLARLNATACVVTNMSGDPRVRGVLGSDTVVYVNGESVSLGAFGRDLVKQFGRRFIGPYIDRHLIFQHAREAGITLAPEALDQRLAEAADLLFAEQAAGQGMSAADYELRFTDQGVSVEEYKRELRRECVPVEDLRAELFAARILAPNIRVTDEDVDHAYRDRYGERIDVRRIVVAELATANRVLDAARGGADFALLVQKESVESLAWMHKGLVRTVTALSPYYQQVKDLPVGRFTDAFRSGGKYVVLKVIARHPAVDPPALGSVRKEIVEEVRAAKALKLIAAWLEKTRAAATIEIHL